MNRKFPRQRRPRDAEREPGERAECGSGWTEGRVTEEISLALKGAAAGRATASCSRRSPRKEPKKYGRGGGA